MMPLRLFPIRSALAASLATLAADPAAPLRVLRTAPADGAPPTSAITVTFDRPVAGSLDRTVDAAALLVRSPAGAGLSGPEPM
jgi:hypothetical protein